MKDSKQRIEDMVMTKIGFPRSAHALISEYNKVARRRTNMRVTIASTNIAIIAKQKVVTMLNEQIKSLRKSKVIRVAKLKEDRLKLAGLRLKIYGKRTLNKAELVDKERLRIIKKCNL